MKKSLSETIVLFFMLLIGASFILSLFTACAGFQFSAAKTTSTDSIGINVNACPK